MINRDKLVNWFIDNFPKFYSDMLDSSHYVDRFQPNIFHVEGTVWTHTMMAMTWIEARYDLTFELNGEVTSDEMDDYVVLLTSAMLHDLGKPTCEEMNEANEKKPVRNSFKGHEGVSVMYSIEVLKKLKKDFPDVYTDDIIELIIKVIGTHGVALDEGDCKLTNLRKQFRITDKKGAVRKVDEGLFSQYSGRKFSSTKNVVPEKEIVFMVGQPCSGKSTEIDKNYSDYARVSRDNKLMEFAPDGMNYSQAYRHIHNDDVLSKEFDRYFEDFIKETSQNEDKVIVDMTMMPMSSRRKMMNKFPKHTRKAVVMMTDYDSLIERNFDRYEREGKNIPEYVFLNMAKGFVYPVEAEGFVDIKLIIN